MKAQPRRVLKPTIIKKNLARQRADVSLTKELASALVRLVLSGKSIFPLMGVLEVVLSGDDGYKTYCISTNTINSWVKRGNVIPETGETLRDVLDKARETYRTNQIEQRRVKMVEEAEKRMHRVLKLRTNQPVIGVRGVIRDENGDIVRRENVSLLRTQMDTARFVTERLASEHYSKAKKEESNTPAFSLSALRRYKEERDARNILN